MPNLLGKIPWVKRLFGRGANSDVRPESLPDGFHSDATNFRISSVEGNNAALERISGEQERSRPSFDEQPVAATYVCIGAGYVTGAEFSFWASINGIVDPTNFPPILKINGVTMARSPLIPYRHNRPLQFGEISRCVGGVVFPVDGTSDPLYWDIPAIQAAFASGSQQYLSLFSLDYVSVALLTPAEWMEFTGLVSGSGLPPGQYSYWLRYVTQNGDRTNNGPPTPLISVPRVQPPVYAPIPEATYPGGQITGGNANPDEQIATAYGIGLRFLVDNRQDYNEVEIVRQRFNNGLGLNGPGIVEVIGRLPIEPGEFQYRTFIDPQDANFFEIIPNDIAQREGVAIEAPKAVEYTDNRVVYANFRLKKRVADLTFRVNALGQRIVAITQKVATYYNSQWYNDGHADPVNNTYLKGAQHNEKYTLGLQFWDGESSRSPVVPVESNFLFPGRADRKTGDSATYSSDQIIRANDECQVTDSVSPTFDAFVQGKTGKNTTSYVNVSDALGDNYNPWTPVGPNDTDTTRYAFSPVATVATSPGNGATIAGRVWSPEIHALGALIYGPNNIATAAPWAKVMGVMTSPPAGRVIAEGIVTYRLTEGLPNVAPSLNKSSSNLIGFFPDIDSAVVPQNISEDVQANPQNYRFRLTPVGFYSEVYGYYSEDTQRFGDVIENADFVSISLGQTAGLSVGMYVSGNGIPLYTTIIAIIPGSGVQLSSDATGTFLPTVLTFYVTEAVDLLSFAGVQFEGGDGPNPQWNVNVGTTPGTQGYQPGASAPLEPTNFVGADKWRRLTSDALSGTPGDLNYSIFMDPSNPAQGGFLFSFSSFNPVVEGRGTTYHITFNERPYTIDGQTSEQSFSSNTTRRFHEPVYIAHLLRTEASVPDLNVQQYRVTGNYIVVAPEGRTIGIAPGGANTVETDYELFHARKDDAVGRFPTDYRYAYVQVQGQPDQRYVCVTGNTFVSANLPTVAADIAANGFWTSPDDGLPVHGIYRYVDQFNDAFISQTAHTIGYLRFGGYVNFPVPPLDARISVKYDNRAPIRAFGFDTTTSPCVFAPFDRAFLVDNGSGNPIVNTAVRNGSPLPYSEWGLSPGYVMLRTGNTAAPQQMGGATSIRQWMMMWHCVQRTQMNMVSGSGAAQAEQFPFPRTHYITRPYRNGSNGELFSQYFLDYPGEDLTFQLGGFRFWTNYNLDYAKQPLITGLGVPRNGIGPRLDYCNAYAASERLDPQQQDSPGLRSFFFENIYPVSEENGEIKMIHVLDQGGQQNLWGFCETGVHFIPYNKAMLTDAEGSLIATQSVDSFWPRPGGERWIARGERGSPNQLWRFAVKAHAALGGGDADTVFWGDRVGVYRLMGSQVTDISRDKFLKVMYPLLQAIPTDYSGRICGAYNYRNSEAWMQIGGLVRVFSAVRNEWVGAFTYNYDQYQSLNGQMIGYRELGSWNLDTGETMFDPLQGNVPIPCSFTVPFFPGVGAYKEAMRWRITQNMPPAWEQNPDYSLYLPLSVEVLGADGTTVISRMNAPTDGTQWAKYYDGFEGWVDRVLATINSQRPLPQDMGFYLRVNYGTLGPKVIIAASMQIKGIK
jgi:hypothetical protein